MKSGNKCVCKITPFVSRKFSNNPFSLLEYMWSIFSSVFIWHIGSPKYNYYGMFYFHININFPNKDSTARVHKINVTIRSLVTTMCSV